MHENLTKVGFRGVGHLLAPVSRPTDDTHTYHGAPEGSETTPQQIYRGLPVYVPASEKTA